MTRNPRSGGTKRRNTTATSDWSRKVRKRARGGHRRRIKQELQELKKNA